MKHMHNDGFGRDEGNSLYHLVRFTPGNLAISDHQDFLKREIIDIPAPIRHNFQFQGIRLALTHAYVGPPQVDRALEVMRTKPFYGSQIKASAVTVYLINRNGRPPGRVPIETLYCRGGPSTSFGKRPWKGLREEIEPLLTEILNDYLLRQEKSTAVSGD